MVARLALTTALALASGAFGLKSKDFNVSLPDTSPMLKYTPAVGRPDAPLSPSQAWNVSFSDTPWRNASAPSTNATASETTTYQGGTTLPLSTTTATPGGNTAPPASSQNLMGTVPPPRDGEPTTSAALPTLGSRALSNSSQAVMSYEPGIIGNGTSMHSTSYVGATVEVSWLGTGIFFQGNGSAELKVDGKKMSPSTDADIIASASDLGYGYHNAVLTVNDGTVSISGVTLTYAMDTDSDTADDSPPWDIVAILDQKPNTYIQSGPRDWTMHTPLGIDGGEQVDYPRMDASAKESYAFFQAPPNSTFFTLWGSTGSDHGNYSIEVDPSPPYAPKIDKGSHLEYFSGYSPFTTPDSLLFAGPLDASQSYFITMKVEEQGALFDFSKATFYNSAWATNGTTSHGTADSKTKGISTGAIAGIAIAATVIALLIIGAIIFFILRKRRQQSRRFDDKFNVLDRSQSRLGSYVDQTHLNTPGGQYYTNRHDGGLSSATSSSYVSAAVLGGGPVPGAMDLKNQMRSTNPNGGLAHDTPDGVAYMTDVDAGPAEQRVQLMPPSYNPDWVETSSSSAGGSSVSGDASLPPGATHQTGRRNSTYKGPIEL